MARGLLGRIGQRLAARRRSHMPGIRKRMGMTEDRIPPAMNKGRRGMIRQMLGGRAMRRPGGNWDQRRPIRGLAGIAGGLMGAPGRGRVQPVADPRNMDPQQMATDPQQSDAMFQQQMRERQQAVQGSDAAFGQQMQQQQAARQQLAQYQQQYQQGMDPARGSAQHDMWQRVGAGQTQGMDPQQVAMVQQQLAQRQQMGRQLQQQQMAQQQMQMDPQRMAMMRQAMMQRRMAQPGMARGGMQAGSAMAGPQQTYAARGAPYMMPGRNY